MKVSHCTVTHHSGSATIHLFSQDSDWWTTLYLYVFFWVIPRRLNFICRHFGTLCLFHLHRQVDVEWLNLRIQKKTYNIQNTVKVWNQEYFTCMSRKLQDTFNYLKNSASQKKTYNIQKMAKVWNQVYCTCIILDIVHCLRHAHLSRWLTTKTECTHKTPCTYIHVKQHTPIIQHNIYIITHIIVTWSV